MHHVQKIIPKDDGFHGSKKLAAEWWYFDGVFSDGYSFHVGIRTFTRKNRGRVILFFELYKDDHIIFEKKQKHSFKEIKTTTDFPSVRVNNESVLDFDMKRYQENNDWVYHINVSIDDCRADLSFTGIAQGFKIETEKESWTVAVPKALVQGTIEYEGKTLSVDGIGYHDHNWNYTLMSAFTYGKGWFWGKIKSDTITIVWANVLKRSGFEDLLSIVCPDHNGFFNINPKNISFEITSYQRFKRRSIPSCIHLSFQDNVKSLPIHLDVTMDVGHVHFTKVFFASYWRYHVHIRGSVSVDETKERIDSMQIMEYLSMI
jgi:hypothetical protein